MLFLKPMYRKHGKLILENQFESFVIIFIYFKYSVQNDYCALAYKQRFLNCYIINKTLYKFNSQTLNFKFPLIHNLNNHY